MILGDGVRRGYSLLRRTRGEVTVGQRFFRWVRVGDGNSAGVNASDSSRLVANMAPGR